MRGIEETSYSSEAAWLTSFEAGTCLIHMIMEDKLPIRDEPLVQWRFRAGPALS